MASPTHCRILFRAGKGIPMHAAVGFPVPKSPSGALQTMDRWSTPVCVSTFRLYHKNKRLSPAASPGQPHSWPKRCRKSSLSNFFIAHCSEKRKSWAPPSVEPIRHPNRQKHLTTHMTNIVSIPLPHLPVSGRTKHFLSSWYKVTRDPFIIQCV